MTASLLRVPNIKQAKACDHGRCIYWIHRLLHHPLVYPTIHKTHHLWKVSRSHPTPRISLSTIPMPPYTHINPNQSTNECLRLAPLLRCDALLQPRLARYVYGVGID